MAGCLEGGPGPLLLTRQVCSSASSDKFTNELVHGAVNSMPTPLCCALKNPTEQQAGRARFHLKRPVLPRISVSLPPDGAEFQ